MELPGDLQDGGSRATVGRRDMDFGAGPDMASHGFSEIDDLVLALVFFQCKSAFDQIVELSGHALFSFSFQPLILVLLPQCVLEDFLPGVFRQGRTEFHDGRFLQLAGFSSMYAAKFIDYFCHAERTYSHVTGVSIA
jgi:hypothetical protein